MASKSKKPVKASGKTGSPEKNQGSLKKNQGNPEKTQGSPEKNQSSLKSSIRKVAVTIGLTVAILIFGSIAFFTTIVVMANASDLRASRAEYDSLRELADAIDTDEFSEDQTSALDEEMRQLNPDYVCWLRVSGTGIDYPVVRGSDNSRYINTSFSGEPNRAGTLFMDYRVTGDILAQSADDSIPHIIIFGHNLQQGGMFGDLRKFLNSQFLEENNIITLIVNDRAVDFEIFSARMSDINDPAYFIDFSGPQAFPRFADRVEAPLKATQIITLSTCTSGGSKDARMIVQGYRLLDSP